MNESQSSNGDAATEQKDSAPVSAPIRYALDAEPEEKDLRALYLEAGWIKEEDDSSLLPLMLRNSFAVSTAFSGDRCIGLMRAFSDGISDAYLLDLVVLKEFRRQGIAREILKRLTGFLRSKQIEWIVCIAAPGSSEFYANTDAASMDGFRAMRFPGAPNSSTPSTIS